MANTFDVSRRALMLGAGAGLATRATAMVPEGLKFEVLAEGLGFPEGPVAMPDGSVIVVEMFAGLISRVWNGRKEVVSRIGGGPNGARIGPDGALYVCNNGGPDPSDPTIADATQPGRVERVDLSTGKVERVIEQVGERKLSAPNDLVFDAHGGMWFTDYGKTLKHSYGRGGIYYRAPDGAVREVVYGGIGYNGIGLSADGRTLYVAMNYSGRLYRMTVEAPGRLAVDPASGKVIQQVVGSGPGEAEFDGLAVTQTGNICIGTNHNGGLTTITPAGEVSFIPMPERLVTNIAFGGPDMRDAYLTWTSSGRLVRMRWHEPGMKLNFG